MDKEKPFDSVCTNGLLIKLKGYRVSGNLLKLIGTVLGNRKTYIHTDSFRYDEFEIQIGLPQ